MVHEVVIVGAGFSGVGMAIRLREDGVETFVILERAPSLGGTWQANTYPGAACDVPSHLYSFSFAPNPDWSRTYSPQPEIESYLVGVAERHDVDKKVRFDQDVTRAVWDGEDLRWRITTASGTTFEARSIVWAAGSLSTPRMPRLPGLESFGGEVFHSATWRHDVELGGKRVAVVGTGASAIQFVPEIRNRATTVTLYQRTPPWVIPRRDREIPRWRRRLFALFPPAQKVARFCVYARMERFIGPIVWGTSPKRSKMAKGYALGHLRRQVADETLRTRLTPSYEIGCKRILVSDDYYPALGEPNVEVVTGGVVGFDAAAVIDAAGVRREADVVIFGTGFDAAEPPWMDAIIGRGGVTLRAAWERGAGAYLGSTVPSFPNFFMVIGPNSTLGHNSMIYMIESHIRYVAGALAFLRRPEVGAVEVRPETFERYQSGLEGELVGATWSTGGCTSWYLDRHGKNTTLWSGKTTEFRRRTRRFHPGDYRVHPIATKVPPPSSQVSV